MLWGMSETAALTEGPCVFCGTPTRFGAHSNPSHMPGPQNPDGSFPLLKLPRVWMCDADLERYQRGEIRRGWCSACWAWGAAFELSPCGELFQPMR